jgi:hypothetical protein
MIHENEFGIIYCDEWTGILLIPDNDAERELLKRLLLDSKKLKPTTFMTLPESSGKQSPEGLELQIEGNGLDYQRP